MNILMALPLNENKLKVLLEIYREGENYLRNIERGTGVNPSLLSKILKRFTEAELISKTKRGKEIFYSLTMEGEKLFVDVLEKFNLDKVSESSGELKVVMRLLYNNSALINGSRKIYLFGSFISGGKTKKSDIDILFVGGKRHEIIKWCREVSLIVGREVSPLIYTPEKFKRELKKKEPMLSSIIKNIKNRIIIK